MLSADLVCEAAEADLRETIVLFGYRPAPVGVAWKTEERFI